MMTAAMLSVVALNSGVKFKVTRPAPAANPSTASVRGKNPESVANLPGTHPHGRNMYRRAARLDAPTVIARLRLVSLPSASATVQIRLMIPPKHIQLVMCIFNISYTGKGMHSDSHCIKGKLFDFSG